ncbi:MAG: hypothetical protein GY811_24790 [Myxococcales bacterium]|nr:hypothetical protein [Myxococcales bacterium]
MSNAAIGKAGASGRSVVCARRSSSGLVCGITVIEAVRFFDARRIDDAYPQARDGISMPRKYVAEREPGILAIRPTSPWIAAKL